MSKTSKRKSGESGKSDRSSSKDSSGQSGQKRQSVFDRLGTKASSTERTLTINTALPSESFCRSWAQNGTCSYGKSCKLAHTHTLISPSKRGTSSKKDIDSAKISLTSDKRVLPSIVRRSPDIVDWDSWDQTELEYEDEKVLEKRRALLQRELELQMKKEGGRKESTAERSGRMKKRRSSSTSSSVSSSSSCSSSSSESTSESSVRSPRRKTDDKKKRRSSSSPSDLEKKKSQSKQRRDASPRKRGNSVERKKTVSPAPRKSTFRKKSPSPRKLSPKSKPSSFASRRKDSPPRRESREHSKRSLSRGRRRSPARSSGRRSRPRSPEPKSKRPPARGRSPDRKKEDDRKKDDRRDRKIDFRDKRDRDDSRSREKAREQREAAREKERLEALERCRERQREREQKEKERLREERERKDGKRSRGSLGRDRGSNPTSSSSDKRHDRAYDRFERNSKGRERSFERERVRDRALERMMERKSIDRNRDRSREGYSDRTYSERRVIPSDEKKFSSSPYRGSERSRYESERERPLSPRDDRRYEGRDRGRAREREGRTAWPAEPASSQRYDDPPREKPRSGTDWSGDRASDFPETSTTRREWDPSRLREETEDWSYERGSDWNRSHSHLIHLNERRSDGSDKDSPSKDVSKDVSDSGKRVRDDSSEELVKRSRPSEPPSLQEELSDISDGPDDILNRDDIEFIEGEESRSETVQEAQPQSENFDETSHGSPHLRGIESRLTEDEGMDGLDFEEISDEELEEESKTNKGTVCDALGVDWASLMAECKPKPQDPNENTSSAKSRWTVSAIFSRLGVSSNLATPAFVNSLAEKYPQIQSSKGPSALVRLRALRHSSRKDVISSSMDSKQALSARTDIMIRRRLCGLPVVNLDAHLTAGFSQWAV